MQHALHEINEKTRVGNNFLRMVSTVKIGSVPWSKIFLDSSNYLYNLIAISSFKYFRILERENNLALQLARNLLIWGLKLRL